MVYLEREKEQGVLSQLKHRGSLSIMTLFACLEEDVDKAAVIDKVSSARSGPELYH
ncbi:hypothetical protein OBBRIDRAFT_28335 [Obba rivulosa]|uniref:Uncharacterized protein n=1 Tax=Obba rivulosa TaxID=1052685 RepID=A0A8E2DJG8_9APHY|nr:hypothetical protein OBBRIDRAFT_28335 [Obba rivulosa]